MLLSNLFKGSAIFAASICSGPVTILTYPDREYIWGKGYAETDDPCEPEEQTLQGHICDLTTEEFDNSCVDSCVAKLVLVNCPEIDFSCSCFKMTCGPYAGKVFSIFRKDGVQFIKRDKTNTCVEIYVVEQTGAESG